MPTLRERADAIEQTAARALDKRYDGQYVIRACAAIDRIHQDKVADRAVRPFLSTECTQCGDRTTATDLTVDHLVYRGWVVICCGGFHQIDPQALGLERGDDWVDWTDVHNIPAVPKTPQEAHDFIWWVERSIAGGFHPDTPASEYYHYGPNGEQGEKLFNQTEERLFDACLDATFSILEDEVYGIGLDAVHFLYPDTEIEGSADDIALRAQEAQTP